METWFTLCLDHVAVVNPQTDAVELFMIVGDLAGCVLVIKARQNSVILVVISSSSIIYTHVKCCRWVVHRRAVTVLVSATGRVIRHSAVLRTSSVTSHQILLLPSFTLSLPLCYHYHNNSVRHQNAAARLVAQLGPRDHVSNALRDLHWLPVQQKITCRLCLLMHLVHNDRAPVYLADSVTATANISRRIRLRSASSLHYEQPRTRLKLGEHCFAFTGPTA